MRTTGRRNNEQLYPTLFGTVAGALGIIVVISASLRLADSLRPQAGDIIIFVPARTGVAASQASLTVMRAGPSPASFCTLRPGVMRQSGGSMIVEAVADDATQRYRVHWVGGHTSQTGNDCGSTADLLLTPGEVAVLTFAADAPGGAVDAGYNRPGMGRRAR